ncbi:carboxypeptidase-like regulatory domain-containing protein [Sediminicola luteus]|uniref:Carboxypeptidase-like regulatory domain-containing protein n=1 Tax=Sediminicola luteus TaxID=319238 RepID=A0A2A4GEH7_9FLAO|nr:carboxypeptidase-like regulatory domain-containing protein [Sediminicola luteus]PCE66142.1 hypothetical protein B7P33_02255 [Sediminicola luteus]
MRQIFFFFLFILVIPMFSQETISGKVLNDQSKAPLAFVNLGVAGKGVGTVSSEKGVFKLRLNENIVPTDTVVFSHIGYATKKIPLSVLIQGTAVIVLEPLPTQLKGVVVKYKKPIAKKLGRKGKGLGLMHQNFYSYYEKDIDDRLSKEMGVRIPVKRDCHVEALNFNITSNQFKSVTFRMNVYAIEGKRPGKLLNTRDIVFQIKDGFLGWYKVDLSPFDIFLEKEQKEVAVTIQWLKSEKQDENSKYFAISTKLATAKHFFYREKTMDEWVSRKSKPSFYIDVVYR